MGRRYRRADLGYSSLLAESATLLLAALPVPALLLTVATLYPSVASLLSAALTVLALSVLSLPVLSLSVLVLPVLPGLPIAAARSCHGFNLVAQTAPPD